MLRILVVALVLLVAAMMLMPRPGAPPPAPENATVLPQGRTLPELSLVDAAGEPFTNGDLAGRFSLMFFGFTHCPDVCPLTLQVLASTIERLESTDPEATPRVVFVSVDPERDTPERIRQYLAGFDPDFEGVTGSDEALAPLLEALGVTVQKHEHEGEHYNVVHNGTVYVIGPRAELVAVSSPPHQPATLAADFAAIRGWYAGRAGDQAGQARNPAAPEPAARVARSIADAPALH